MLARGSEQSFLARFVLVVTAVLAACGGEGSRDAHRLSVSSELSSPRDIEVSLSMPAGVPIERVAVAGATGVALDVETTITGVVSTAAGTIVADHATRMTGDMVAVGDITLRGGTRVDGTARATGNVQIDPGGGAEHAEAHAGITTTAPHWSIHRDAFAPPVALVRGQTRQLMPGSYDQILIGPGATLTLGSGAYFARKLIFFRGSRLIVNSRDGIVQLYAEEELYYRPTVSSIDGGRSDLLVTYLGAEETLLAPAFKGVFVAPTAPVIVGGCDAKRDDEYESRYRDSLQTLKSRPGQDDEHATAQERHEFDDHCSHGVYDGPIYGSSVHVEHGVTVSNRPFDWLSVVETTSRDNVNLFSPAPDFANMPKFQLPRTPFDDDFIVDAPLTAPGREQGITSALDPTLGGVSFTMPSEYPTAGGVIANGTVELRFRSSAGALITCSYRGLAPTATPVTPDDLNLGRAQICELLRWSDVEHATNGHKLRGYCSAGAQLSRRSKASRLRDPWLYRRPRASFVNSDECPSDELPWMGQSPQG